MRKLKMDSEIGLSYPVLTTSLQVELRKIKTMICPHFSDPLIKQFFVSFQTPSAINNR